MIPRLYFPQPLQSGQRLKPDAAVRRYLLRSLRLAPGAPLLLFNGLEKGEWRGRLALDASGQIEVVAFVATRRESPLAITLIQGVAKPDAMAFVVQKAVELGVVRIIPLLCRRSSSNMGSHFTENRQRRLQRIAVEAAEQSGRVTVPEIGEALPWERLANQLTTVSRWLFWEESEGAPGVCAQPYPGPSLSLLIGPEGGLEADEVAFARDHLAFDVLTLGPRILRTTTAALAAITTCQTLWGDMGGDREGDREGDRARRDDREERRS